MSRPLAGHPQSEGAKVGSVIVVTGPASYVPVSVGSPPSGGQTVEAVSFGLKRIEHAFAGLSDNGQYNVLVGYPDPTQPTATIFLMWIVAATGLEASGINGGANLSDRSARIRAIGM